MAEVSGRYNECVYYSAISQLWLRNVEVDFAADEAFRSCGTEKTRMTLALRSAGFSAEQIEDVFYDKNVGLRRELRTMFLDAKRIKRKSR